MQNLIKGDFHFHSLHSDCQVRHRSGHYVEYNTTCGQGAVMEMFQYSQIASKNGYQYLAVTNHSTNPVSAKPATKYEVKMLLEHLRQVEQLNEVNKKNFHILSGAEVNILNQSGKLSIADNILKKLEIVIASNHRSTGKLSKSNIKGGFIGAIKNKEVDIMGHLTRYVRRLNTKDWQEIIDLAEKHQKIIEFNIRAPLYDSVLKLVAKSKVLISVGSDTHPEIIKERVDSAEDYVKLSIKNIKTAVRHLEFHGIKQTRIINTFGWKKLKNLLKLPE